MTLKAYRRKRDFRRTPEPAPSAGAKRGWLYVVQKHSASHLHYDFRLQLGDRLLSWAVPKGPSLDPSVKRLAMHVEDHPVEYGAFEGTIPAGQYGAGTVMLWDRGTWEPQEDPDQGYRQGKLHFTLHGEKLKGEWVLVRRSSGNEGPADKQPWFLFKVRDRYARPEGPDVLLEDRSVASGRDLEEIGAGRKSMPTSSARRSRGSASPTKAKKPKTARRKTPRLVKLPPGAVKAPLPRKLAPQLATLVKKAPEGDRWFNEIKLDGYRMIARVSDGKVTLLSRNQLDWTDRLPYVAQAIEQLGLRSAIFDGEVVALLPNGASSFQALQNVFREGRGDKLVYYLFDLVYFEGRSLAKLPLEERKQILAEIVSGQTGVLRFCEHVEGHAAEFFRQACKHGLEGIICKRRDRPYVSGRGPDWLKVKCLHREEFVVGGYTPPAGSRTGFGALLVGYHRAPGELMYAGRVGTGFSDRVLDELARRLKALEQARSPFENLSGKTGQARGVHWVRPKLVAEVEFGEWTRDGMLRHPAFLGLREDKSAAEVVREQPVAADSLEDATPVADRKSKGSKRTSRVLAHTNQPTNLAQGLELPRGVRLTHPEKVLFPDPGLTKADLVRYYTAVADWILPQLKERPLVLVRCPEGLPGSCFFQKHARAGTPEALLLVPIVEGGQKHDYVAVDDLAGLLSLVQISALEIHAWGSRIDKLEQPDRLVFDLDPDPGVPWRRVVESARQIRDFFAEMDLRSFVKTTGGKGLHIVLPISRRMDWDQAKTFCRGVAQSIAKADPDRYTINISKAARPGKILIDYLRNARGATSVVAYSTRARTGAPVSTPVHWHELGEIDSAAEFDTARVVQRLARLKSDPWQELGRTRQSIAKSLLKQFGA